MRVCRSRFPVFALLVVLLALMTPSANAIPAFARMHKTSCQTCHIGFPKLNAFGEAFRLGGYRMPGEMQPEEKQQPLGGEAMPPKAGTETMPAPAETKPADGGMKPMPGMASPRTEAKTPPPAAETKMWPQAIWPSDMPAQIPLAVNIKMASKMASVYASSLDENGRSVTKNDFQFPQEANLFAAGTL